MNLTPEMIKEKSTIGRTKQGAPVVMVETHGGLFAIFTKKDGDVVTLATAPHKGIARHFAEKKDPDITWKDLDEDIKKHEADRFIAYRELLFSATRLQKSQSDNFIVYDTDRKCIEFLSKGDLLEAIRQKDIKPHYIVRNLFLTEPPQFAYQHPTWSQANE